MATHFLMQGLYRPGSQPTQGPRLPSTTLNPPQSEDDEPPPPYALHDTAQQRPLPLASASTSHSQTSHTTRHRASSSTTTQTRPLPRSLPQRLALLRLDSSTPTTQQHVIAADTDPTLLSPAPCQVEHLYAVTLKRTTFDTSANPHAITGADSTESSAFDQHPLFGTPVSSIPDLIIHPTRTAETALAPLVTARARSDGQKSKDGNPISNDTLLRMQHISPFASTSTPTPTLTSPSSYPKEKGSMEGYGGADEKQTKRPSTGASEHDYPPEKGQNSGLNPLQHTAAAGGRMRSNSSHGPGLRDLPLSSSIEQCLVAQTDYPSMTYSFGTYVDAAAPAISLASEERTRSLTLVQPPQQQQQNTGRTRWEKFEWRRAPALNPMAAIGLGDDGAGGGGSSSGSRKGKKKKQARRLDVYLDLLLGDNELGNDEDGDGYMWQLVRCAKPRDGEVKEAGVDPDVAIFKGEMTEQREEVVAVWTFAGRGVGGGGLMGKLDAGWKRLSMRGGEGTKKSAGGEDQKVLLFKFLGTGATGMLGERWGLLAVASAVRMYQVLRTC